jgi:hypothetical protein
MYYKEEWINGKLFWKASPNGEWIEFTKQQYAERLLKAESELKNLQLGAVFSFFKKVFTHNYCDTCGFTKDKVYVTEICMEAGIIQCDKCSGQNCT